MIEQDMADRIFEGQAEPAALENAKLSGER